MREPILETINLCADDERVELPENRPFIIRGSKSNGVGILLVHGFTGSPWEMRTIGLHQASNHALVLGIRLPGHGTSAADLANRTYEEWLDAVFKGYRYLARECDRVIGIGLSTGALLLLAAAGEVAFARLVLLSPYLKLRQWLAPFSFLLRYFVKYNRRPADMVLMPYYYRDRPLASVHQIYRLIRRVRKILPEISIPVFVASAEGDITVDSSSAIKLFNMLGSATKEYHQFGKEVPHVLTTTDNPRLDELLRMSTGFTEAINAN